LGTTRQIRHHWLYVTRHFFGDVILFCAAFIIGIIVRFGSAWEEKWILYLPAVLCGALSLACASYLCGLYSPYRNENSIAKRIFLIFFAFHLAFLVAAATGYIDWSARIGRGVMLFGYLSAAVLVGIHQTLLYLRIQNYRERVTFVVNSPSDERESRIFKSLRSRQLTYVGMVSGTGYTTRDQKNFLGNVASIEKIIREKKIHRVLCTASAMDNPEMRQIFCQLRYSGITVVSLASLCEEVYQLVPLELVTPQWLLSASDSPHLFYIKKVKRAFDVVVSLSGLLLLGPFALAGMIATKLTSPGPVLYRQTRTGRFGKLFQVIKLRTMRPDAETGGAQWSSPEGDPRVTTVGRFLRTYRIDEIPQLINVLRGEMSFVGPRPERPEFIDTLAEEIPYFKERLLVQPGITGWAQVRFPYAATNEDARRKLEYDLYYMKHMSVFLDTFILLDTILIILRGGLGSRHQSDHPVTRAFTEHMRVADSGEAANLSPTTL